MTAPRKQPMTERQKFTKSVLKHRKKRATEADKMMLKRYGSSEPTAETCEKQGKAHRAATVDRAGRLRRPSCVKSQPGIEPGTMRSKVRIVVKQGTLAPWKASLPAEERHRALLVALERLADQKSIGQYEAAVSIARKLNTLYIYRKNNANPAVVETCNKVLDDEEWLRNRFDMAPLGRKQRQCPLPAAADLNRAIVDDFVKRANRATQQKQKKQARAKVDKKPQTSSSWNEFRSRHKGQGYSQAELSHMYRSGQ